MALLGDFKAEMDGIYNSVIAVKYSKGACVKVMYTTHILRLFSYKIVML